MKKIMIVLLRALFIAEAIVAVGAGTLIITNDIVKLVCTAFGSEHCPVLSVVLWIATAGIFLIAVTD